jgi:uncharacterized protein YegJ (DUF2314 family)
LIGSRALGAIFALGLCFVAATASAQTAVSRQNEAVNASIAKARETLPVFFARLAKPERGDSDFQVKIRYDTSKPPAGEHIWARDVVREGDKVSATIATKPYDIPDLKQGQRVTVPISQLTDWLYVRDNKYHGAYTVRALLPFMKPEDAEQMKRDLAPE